MSIEKHHGEDVVDGGLSETDLIELATKQGEEESKLGIKALFKLYYPAATWSMLLSTALIMEGMDTGIINNFFAQSAYVAKFGIEVNGKKTIPADWQAAINNCQSIGAIIGLVFNGWAQYKYGSRKVYMLGMALLAAAIFVLVFAQNLSMLVAGNLLCGIPWGIFQTLTTAYAAEICPTAMRGYLTTWVSMCWGCGSFLAAGILRASLQLPDDWAWRMPYVLQWAWPAPLFLVGFLAPESPWHLVRTGNYEQAAKVLKRLARKGHLSDLQVAAEIALIKHTNEKEKEDAANGSWLDCFKGVNLRRTEIACATFAIQVWTGQGITGYATTFLTVAGMSQVMAFNYSMAIQSVNIICTGTVILLMGKVGRRRFYLCGVAAIAAAQLLIGILGLFPTTTTALGVAIMLIIVQVGFKLSVGPVCYALVADMPNSRLRSRSIVLARTSYIISGIITSQLIPRMLSATAWNWGAKCGWFWFGTGAICFTYTFFRIPETKDRSFFELDHLFQTGVPARKFKTTAVDVVGLTQETIAKEKEAAIEADKPVAVQLEYAPAQGK